MSQTYRSHSDRSAQPTNHSHHFSRWEIQTVHKIKETKLYLKFEIVNVSLANIILVVDSLATYVAEGHFLVTYFARWEKTVCTKGSLSVASNQLLDMLPIKGLQIELI